MQTKDELLSELIKIREDAIETFKKATEVIDVLKLERAHLLNELEMIEALTTDATIVKRIRNFMYEKQYWSKHETES